MGKPKIRFKGYTDEWEQRKLGELAVFNPKEELPNEFEYVDLESVVGTEMLFHRTENKATAPSRAQRLAHTGDLFYQTVRPYQKNNYLFEKPDKHYVFSTGYAQLRPFIDGYFLLALVQNGQFVKVVLDNCTGTSYPAINSNDLAKIEVFSPTDENEHHQIGAYFRYLDHLITLHQRKYEQAKTLKKYMLQKMFPQDGMRVPEIRFAGFTDEWDQRKLGDLVLDHNAGIYISKEDYGSGTNVIGVGNIYDNDIFDGEIYRLGPVTDESFLLEENDLVYGESSLVPEGIARTVCVAKNGAGSAFAWHTRRVKLDQNFVNSHFATLELNYNATIRKYLMSVSTQTALTGMTTEGYFGATLLLPSVEEQATISELFKYLDNLITLHQRKCDELRKIKKYMLQNMFC